MGCLESKQSAGKQGKIIFLHGFPCAGKTFYTDYLNSIGWEMVDGDDKLYSKNNKVAKDFATAVNFVYKYHKGQPYEERDKKYMINHFKELGQRAKKMASRGKDVVISFFAPLRFLREELYKVIPEVTFIFLEVEKAVLVERNFIRL